MYQVYLGFSLVAISAWLVSEFARRFANQKTTDHASERERSANQEAPDLKKSSPNYQLGALGAITLVLVCFVAFFGDQFNDKVQRPHVESTSQKHPFDPNAGYFFALQTLTTVGYGGPLPGCDQSSDRPASLETFRSLSVWAMIFGPPLFGVWVTLLYLVGIKPITKESV